MNDIYAEIAKLSDKFRSMAYGLTKDKNKIDNAVQELMLYFLSMNPDVLSKIWKKDGINGITRYGAVALRRALTSTRSSFFYKYEKFYSHIDNSINTLSCTPNYDNLYFDNNVAKSLHNIPNEKIDNWQLNKLEEIDKVLDNCTWYDKKIFELYYYEGNTLDSLHKKTRISRNSLFTTIDKVRTMLKEKLNE